MLRILINIGARTTKQQLEAYTKAQTSDIVTVINKITSTLFATNSTSLSGGTTVTALDAVVATILYEYFGLLFAPAMVGSTHSLYSNWFTYTTRNTPVVKNALDQLRCAVGGITREGGQIDARASPVYVAALADSSIARNANYKKQHATAETVSTATSTASSGAAAITATSGKSSAVAPPSVPANANVPAVTVDPAAVAAQIALNRVFPTKSADERIAIGIELLKKHSVNHTTVHRHEPALTAESLLTSLANVTGGKCKNLLVKAKKEKAPGDSRVWLVIALTETKVDLVQLATKLGYGKIVIRFADAETLVDSLGVVQGHVSPLCLTHDEVAKTVNVCIDSKLINGGYTSLDNPLFFHPFDNSASIGITGEGLLALVKATGHEPVIVDF